MFEIRQVILFFALFLIPNVHFAQINISTNKATATYNINETMQFLISSNQSGTVQYRIYSDQFTENILSGTLNLTAGQTVSLPFTAQEPSVVFCSVFQNGVANLASAAFSPFQIPTLETEPSDFDAFWEKQKQNLAAIPMNANVSYYRENGSSTTYRFNANIVDNRKVYGYISIPKATTGTFPAIISLPSFGDAPNLVTPDEALCQEVQSIVVALNVHNAEPDQKDPNAYKPDNTLTPEGFYYRYALLGVFRTIDYLMTRNDFNKKQIGVIGTSQGGGLAILSAGLDKRIGLLIASNPALCEHQGLRYNKASGFPYYLLNARNANLTAENTAKVAQSAKYYDAVFAAKRINIPSYFIISYEDAVTPAATSFAAFNQILGKKQVLQARDLDHTHPNEYWNGRQPFIRRHFPNTIVSPWGLNNGYLVDAGQDASVKVGDPLSLNGTAQLFNLSPNFIPKWEKHQGDGEVIFSNSTSNNTSVTFSKEGRYILRFGVQDNYLLNTEGKFYTFFDFIEVNVEKKSVGNDEIARLENSIQIFPNPAQHYLDVQLKIENDEQIQASIYKNNGQLLWHEKLNPSEKNWRIALNDFSNGVYILVLKNKNGDLIARKTFVKQ